MCFFEIVNIAHADSFEITLWIDHKRAAKLYPKESIREHPCGAVTTKKLTRLPVYRASGIVQPERVVEFSRSGKVLRTWSIPVDVSVVGVDGNSVVVGGQRRTFAVDGQRYIRTYPTTENEGVLVTCPLSKVFGRSDYARCMEFADKSTKLQRRLGFEGVCT